MKYKLIKEIDNNLSPIQQILNNRGIKLSEIHHYLNTTDEDIANPLLFGKENMEKATIAIANAVNNNLNTLVLVDCDCDGYTSAAILINYLYDLFPTFVTQHLKYYLHEDKTHGLSDCIDYIEKNDFKLIIIPDAASNDYEYHFQLKEEGRQIIILDHHEAPEISKNAIVINNQLSDYPNKQLSGAGVVWQFCRYFDKIRGGFNADQYIDLAALGNCGDMMSLRSIETKHIITKGFRQENIQNPFIYGMAEKNSYSLGNKITPIGAAFYIVPFVNSMVRSGTLEEKELLFKSMLKSEAFKEILSNKRGHKLGETEKLVDQALRTATNVKSRQTREQDKGMELVEALIERNNMMVAKYQRPTLMLTKHDDLYTGSARGYSKSGIDNFKDICQATGLVEYAEGHQNAFGIGITVNNINKFIELTDIALKDLQSEPLYYVDYIFKGVDVNPEAILEIANLNDIWGQDIDESLICIENLKVTKETLTLMSPDKKPTLKITLPNKIALIKFGSSQEEYEKLLSNGYVEINVIGKCNANE